MYYQRQVEKANSHKYLCHFTNFDALQKIIDNKSLRLSKITELNDPIEAKRVTSVWHNKCFILSFTNTFDNSGYFWKEYAFDNGVCIVFNNKNIKDNIFIYYEDDLNIKVPSFQYICDNDCYDENVWGFFDITKADVMYVDDIEKYAFENKTEISAGLIKSKFGENKECIVKPWELECETRIRVAVKTKQFEYISKKDKKIIEPPFKYLYIDLPQIDKVIISPQCENRDRKIIENYLKDKEIKME